MDIVIPNLAESVTEGDLGRWLKKDGDRVAKDDLILELETDKATVELAAEASGTLEILVQAGETVHVGDVVGRIVEAGAGQPAAEKKLETDKASETEKPKQAPEPAPVEKPNAKEPETGRKKEPETGREKEPEMKEKEKGK